MEWINQVDRSSRSISAEVESIDRVDSSRVDRLIFDGANMKSSQSIISTRSRLLAVVQILLSTVNSDHHSNCCYAIVTNTDFD